MTYSINNNGYVGNRPPSYQTTQPINQPGNFTQPAFSFNPQNLVVLLQLIQRLLGNIQQSMQLGNTSPPGSGPAVPGDTFPGPGFPGANIPGPGDGVPGGNFPFPGPGIPGDTFPITEPGSSRNLPVTQLGGGLYRIGDVETNGSVALVNGSELPAKFEEFRQSGRFPDIASQDLVTTDWGYSGSSTVLQSFYQYLFDTEPRATPAPGFPGGNTPGTGDGVLGGTGTFPGPGLPGNDFPEPGSSLRLPVTQVDGGFYRIGDLDTNGSVALVNGSELPGKFAEFEQSDQFPDIASADLITTDWGYSGSSTVLQSFYQYLFNTENRIFPAL